MYPLIMVASILLNQQPDIERGGFTMIAPLTASPAEPVNRLVEDKNLRDKVVKKVESLVGDHKGNTTEIKTRLVTKKSVDWFYGLPDVHGALTVVERIELDDIISKEINKPEPVQMENSPKKEWFWSAHAGYNILLYGWTDTTGQKRYYLREQKPEVQAILNK